VTCDVPVHWIKPSTLDTCKVPDWPIPTVTVPKKAWPLSSNCPATVYVLMHPDSPKTLMTTLANTRMFSRPFRTYYVGAV